MTICRICLDTTQPSTFISPCSCRGTLKYVHPSCLQKWQSSTHRISCEICQSKYTLASSRMKSSNMKLMVGGIRFVCFVATLSYGILWLKLFQLVFYLVGLAPTSSSLQSRHPDFEFKILLTAFEVVKIVGPSIAISAQAVSLKKNYFMFKWVLLWMLLTFVSQYWVLLSVIQDLLFVGCTLIGGSQLLIYAFETAENMSPVVHLISENLSDPTCL